jgi:hypothetical protein
MKVRLTLGALAVALMLSGALPGPSVLEAQGPEGRWPLQPRSSLDRVIAPFLEGWYANEDGSYTFSFGYLNMNDEAVEIPLGEGNVLEPAQFDGKQPTTFSPGRHRGVFAVTVPAALAGDDVWWSIRNPKNGEVARVPGRNSAAAYQLDWIPRPHGSLPPQVSFGSDAQEGRGPPGIMSGQTLTAAVGSPVALSVNARDISDRDREDARFAEDIPLRVAWSKYRGPGEVEYTKHESTPDPPPPDSATAAAADSAAARAAAAGLGGRGDRGPRPEVIRLPEGNGTVSVYMTFSAPGDYIMRAQVDNFGATDSGSGDQCCWTNGYVRVTVRQ